MSRPGPAKVILCFCFLILLDWCFLAPVRTGAFQPVFLYLLVLYAVFEWPWQNALRFTLAAGILRDILSTQPLGVETAVLGTAASALAVFVTKIERQSWTMRILTGVLFIFTVSLFIPVISSLLGLTQQSVWKCFSAAGSAAFSTILFLPFLFPLFRVWFSDKAFLRQYELFR